MSLHTAEFKLISFGLTAKIESVFDTNNTLLTFLIGRLVITSTRTSFICVFLSMIVLLKNYDF